MTYGYGDESPRGRSTHRSDESDEAYQSAADPQQDRRYAPHNYESAAPSAPPAGGYPGAGYPQGGVRPSDYGHTQDDYGQRTHAQPTQYGAPQYGGGQPAAYPGDGPYPPRPAGPYPPQPGSTGQFGMPGRGPDEAPVYGRGPYQDQTMYGGGRGATAYQPQTYGGRGPAHEQTGYQQAYQPQTYQPQQTGTFPAPAYQQRGYPAPAQRMDDSGRFARQQYPDDGYGDVGLEPPAEPPRKSKRRLIAVLVVLVVLIAGGFAAKHYLTGNDSGTTSTAQVNKPTDDQAKKVESQKVDAKPLTAAEVFGAGTIPSNADGGGTYKVVKSQVATDCKSAVGGDVATALSAGGCTQVVRATMTSPDGNYVVTAGIFNLSDTAAASASQTAIRSAIDSRKGRFSGFAAGSGTDVVAQAAANIAWDTRGHYLMYCVIVLANGKAIAADDKRTSVIVSDVVESYLGGTVIHARELAGASPAAS